MKMTDLPGLFNFERMIRYEFSFGLPDNIIPVMMFAMGYPSERSKPNAWHFKRMPLEDFVTEL